MALFGNKKSDADAKELKKDGSVKDEATSMQDLYSGVAVVTGSKKKTSTSNKSNDSYRVLVKPLITEKATTLVGTNKYVFVVFGGANKIEIAKAIKATYNVTPISVNVVNVKGKKVARGRVKGQRSDWRKAIVTLAKGDSIKIYEGV